MVIVLMGVSGSGKTTVGEALASVLAWPFVDADAYQPPANVAKMRAGHALDDDDRKPWLDALVVELQRIQAGGGNAVLACSALKQVYRDRLAAAGELRYVHLSGDYATIAARVASRHHRYMPATLLDSQYATLEPPTTALTVDISLPVPAQVALIVGSLPAHVPAAP